VQHPAPGGVDERLLAGIVTAQQSDAELLSHYVASESEKGRADTGATEVASVVGDAPRVLTLASDSVVDVDGFVISSVSRTVDVDASTDALDSLRAQIVDAIPTAKNASEGYRTESAMVADSSQALVSR
jgi:hypothetical protein